MWHIDALSSSLSHFEVDGCNVWSIISIWCYSPNMMCSLGAELRLRYSSGPHGESIPPILADRIFCSYTWWSQTSLLSHQSKLTDLPLSQTSLPHAFQMSHCMLGYLHPASFSRLAAWDDETYLGPAEDSAQSWVTINELDLELVVCLASNISQFILTWSSTFWL